MDSKIEKRRKRLTILLIPDDDTEPFSLNVSMRAVKIMALVALVLLLHMILGGIFYWQYAVLSKENNSLVKENDDLKITRERVYKLLPEVAELQRKNDKMLNALGVNRRSYPFSHTNPLEANQPVPSFSAENAMGEAEPIVQEPVSESLDFLKEKDSQYHDFVRNMPTRLPVAGYMSQDFNLLSWFSVAKDKSHLGIDIVADVGTPIHAAGDGFVVFSDWTFPMGNLIIIYHGSGFFSYYGHNHRNVVVEKTTVRKGEVIGFVGNSGKSSGPHLHFEVWRNGSPLDPKDVLLSFH
jgi:murein DD-endopeptidase MepM/ murein hydrolase activator NlpD